MKVPLDCDRCIFEFSDGRRCRGWRRGNGIFLCHTHQKVQERREQLKAEAAAPIPATDATASFSNVVPGAAEEVIAGVHAGPHESVAAVHNLIEQILLMVVNNSITARSANACTQLLRLLLKAQPMLEKESLELNYGLEQLRLQALQASGEASAKAHAAAAD